MSESSAPKIKKLPFILGDVALLIVAWVIYYNSEGSIDGLEAFWGFTCVFTVLHCFGFFKRERSRFLPPFVAASTPVTERARFLSVVPLGGDLGVNRTREQVTSTRAVGGRRAVMMWKMVVL